MGPGYRCWISSNARPVAGKGAPVAVSQEGLKTVPSRVSSVRTRVTWQGGAPGHARAHGDAGVAIVGRLLLPKGKPATPPLRSS